MARTLSVPLQSRPAGVYGPFTIDQRQLGDFGAVIAIARSTDGVWPGANDAPAMDILVEFDYGQGFIAQGNPSGRFFGGTQQLTHGGTRLLDHYAIGWAKELINGVMTPVPPDAVRVTFTQHMTLNAGAALQWLSQ